MVTPRKRLKASTSADIKAVTKALAYELDDDGPGEDDVAILLALQDILEAQGVDVEAAVADLRAGRPLASLVVDYLAGEVVEQARKLEPRRRSAEDAFRRPDLATCAGECLAAVETIMEEQGVDSEYAACRILSSAATYWSLRRRWGRYTPGSLRDLMNQAKPKKLKAETSWPWLKNT